jgi:[acyl-carrier-protein] S-malonyltransferase
MAEAASEFRTILEATPFGKPATPFVANTTARPLSDPQAIRQALGRQLTSPVRWSEAIRWMIDQGVDTFVEVGPKDVLTRLVRRIDRGVQRFTTAQALGIEE